MRFHESDAHTKIIVGPYGSGKSRIVCEDIKFYGLAQAANRQGIRSSKIGFIRASFPELITSSRGSLLEVLPEGFGTINESGSPIRGIFDFPLPDGTRDQMILEGWQVKSFEDCSRLRSANWSFAWINEATGIDDGVLAYVQSRIGRYPAGDCNYSGVLLDCNMPSKDHWLREYIDNPPPGVFVVVQPPAAFKHVDDAGRITYEMNPNAENLQNLKGGTDYYKLQIDTWVARGRYDIVDSWFCMLDTDIQSGKAVFGHSFSSARHVASTELTPMEYTDTIIGYDTSGIHPAVVIAQMQHGVWCILDELYGEEVSSSVFIDSVLLPLLRSKYRNCTFRAACDKADPRNQYNMLRPTEQLMQAGIPAVTAKTNNPRTRIMAVEEMLNKHVGGFLISPNCKFLISALSGEYKYKKLNIQGSSQEIYDPTPVKNNASHIADALQYLALDVYSGALTTDVQNDRRVQEWSVRRRQLMRIM